MKKEIKKLILNIEKFEVTASDTLAVSKNKFTKDSKQFINDFLVEYQLLSMDLQKYSNELYTALHENISSSKIKDDLSKLLVVINGTLSNESISINNIQQNLIIDIVQNLIKVKSNLRIILKKLKINKQTFFNEENINKQELVSYLNSAMATFESSAGDISPKEKEKVIVYFKETIKEVEKPKTSWDKVVGAIGILSALVTLYVSTPDAAEKLNKDLKGAMGVISKEIKLEKKPKIPDNLLLDSVKETGTITI